MTYDKQLKLLKETYKCICENEYRIMDKSGKAIAVTDAANMATAVLVVDKDARFSRKLPNDTMEFTSPTGVYIIKQI